MKKTAVVYWSGTGNTQAMAEAVAEGMKSAGAEVALLTPDQVKGAELAFYDAIAFGCPAMGSEVLEEMEFQPMFDACKRSLGGKSAALFGSYGWGDGEWMRSWEKDCGDAGINLVCESVICCDAPDEQILESCRAVGKKLAQ
ncbi:MAG: flavodoxin [Oscillospiraceae bacterium]|nr:flavodoxin [Oscillospiraceae bacterium]